MRFVTPDASDDATTTLRPSASYDITLVPSMVVWSSVTPQIDRAVTEVEASVCETEVRMPVTASNAVSVTVSRPDAATDTVRLRRESESPVSCSLRICTELVTVPVILALMVTR